MAGQSVETSDPKDENEKIRIKINVNFIQAPLELIFQLQCQNQAR